MSKITIYSIVIVLYLVILLLIGYLTSRKSKSSEGYFVGGRSVGPWVTAISFLAAYFSTVVIVGGGGFGYKFGMATLWIGASNVLIGCALAWIVVGRRLRRFSGHLKALTISDFFAQRYDSQIIRTFSAGIIFIFMTIYNVSVLKGMGNIFQGIMEIPYIWGIIIAGVIILVYVTFGGYLAVVWTGFIQGWVMIFGVLLLTFTAIKAAGGLENVNNVLREIEPGLLESPGVWGYGGLISFCLIVSLGVWGMPQLMIRFYSIKNTKVFRIGTIVATIGGCLALLPYLSGAVAKALFHIRGIQLSSPDLAIPELAQTVLSPFGSAIFLAAVLSAGMSTFASVLIICSGAIVNDIYNKVLKRNLDDRQAQKLGRIWSFVAGLISLLIAFKPPALILVITGFAWAVIASTTLWPLLFGIYVKWVTKTAVICSMIAGASVALVWQALGKPLCIHGFIPGIVVGLILIIVLSLITKGYDEKFLKKVWY